MTTSPLESAIAVCEDADVAEFTVAAAAREELARLREALEEAIKLSPPWRHQRTKWAAALSGERS